MSAGRAVRRVWSTRATRKGLFVEHLTIDTIKSESAESVTLWAQLLTGLELDEDGNLGHWPPMLWQSERSD